MSRSCFSCDYGRECNAESAPPIPNHWWSTFLKKSSKCVQVIINWRTHLFLSSNYIRFWCSAFGLIKIVIHLRLNLVEYSRNSVYTWQMSSVRGHSCLSSGQEEHRNGSTRALQQRERNPISTLGSSVPPNRIRERFEPKRHSSSNSGSELTVPRSIRFNSNSNSQQFRAQSTFESATGPVNPTVNAISVLREMWC